MIEPALIVTVLTALGVPAAAGAYWAYRFRSKEIAPATDLAQRQADIQLATTLRDELRKDRSELRERMERIEKAARQAVDDNATLERHLRELKGRVEVGETERAELAGRLERSEEENARLKAANARIIAQNASLHRDNVELREQNFQLIGANTLLIEENTRLRDEITDFNSLMKARNSGGG